MPQEHEPEEPKRYTSEPPVTDHAQDSEEVDD